MLVLLKIVPTTFLIVCLRAVVPFFASPAAFQECITVWIILPNQGSCSVNWKCDWLSAVQLTAEPRAGLRAVLDHSFHNVKVSSGIYDHFWHHLRHVLYYCNFTKITCFVISWIMALETIIEVAPLHLLRTNSSVSVSFVIEMLGSGCVSMPSWRAVQILK